MIEISNSVGFEGANLREDVIIIQNALNRIPSQFGGPTHPLVVDGLNGPALQAAIGRLQLHYFKWSDLRINRRGRTIGVINSILAGQTPSVQIPGFTTDEIRQITQTSRPNVTDLILGSVTKIRGDCFLNREELEAGRNYPFGPGSRIGTGNSGYLTILWHNSATCGQDIGPGCLIVALGRAIRQIDAGYATTTRLERGTLAAHLNALAGL